MIPAYTKDEINVPMALIVFRDGGAYTSAVPDYNYIDTIIKLHETDQLPPILLHLQYFRSSSGDHSRFTYIYRAI